MQGTSEVFVSEEGAVKTRDGEFILQNLPEGKEIGRGDGRFVAQ